MSYRPSSLIFTDQSEFMPPGLPLDVWEVITDTNCTYEVEPSGKLIRKDRINGTRWSTPEYTGSFTITNVPKHSMLAHMYVVFVVCGVVTNITAIEHRKPIPLNSLDWRWLLDALNVDKAAVQSCKTYRGCLELILRAEADHGYKTGDTKLDAMIGMALCRPSLLRGNARNALELLEDYQLRAISSWHRANIGV